MFKVNPATKSNHASQAGVLLVIYGSGGHCTEMGQLLKQLVTANSELSLVSMGPNELKTPVLAHYNCADIRSKNSRIKTLLAIMPSLFRLMTTTVRIKRRYLVTGVISTGPGLCVLPMLMMRTLGIKTVFVETYCRFHSRSMTARVMSKIAHRFLVQNKQQLSLYPNAQYCGRL